jgi:hypothetical protein
MGTDTIYFKDPDLRRDDKIMAIKVTDTFNKGDGHFYFRLEIKTI